MAVIAVLLAFTATAPAQASPRIVNGDTANPAEFTFLGALLEADEFRTKGAYQAQFCAANLISPTTMITAAHCVVDQKTGEVTAPDQLLVAFGSTLGSPNLKVIGISKITSHPNYRLRTAENDIAVLTLAQPVTDITPVTVLAASEVATYAKPGDIVRVAGWGNTSASTNQFPDALRSATLRVFPAGACGDGERHELGGVTFQGFDASEASAVTMICAAGTTMSGDVIDACQGDSGGPLLAGDGSARRLVGVVSWGEKCASLFPGVYTRISAEFDFLRNAGALTVSAPTQPPSLIALGRNQEIVVTVDAAADGADATSFTVNALGAQGDSWSCVATAAPGTTSGTCTIKGLVNDVPYQVTATASNALGTSPTAGPISATPTTLPTAGKVTKTKRLKNSQLRVWVTASDSNGGEFITDLVRCVSGNGRVTQQAEVVNGKATITKMRPGKYQCTHEVTAITGTAQSAAVPVRIPSR